jgi:hypothetical protein
MKHRITLAALALSLPLLAPAQTMKAPADPGMAKPPADSGAVVVPPAVNDKSVATPPKNIDPEIHSATGDIDRTSKEKSEDKKKLKKPHGARKDSAPATKP